MFNLACRVCGTRKYPTTVMAVADPHEDAMFVFRVCIVCTSNDLQITKPCTAKHVVSGRKFAFAASCDEEN